MTTSTRSKATATAVLADGDARSTEHRTIHGVAISNDEITNGLNGQKKWVPDELERAAETLKGSVVTAAPDVGGLDVEGALMETNHGQRVRVGQITDSAHEDDVGVVYEMDVENEDIYSALALGDLDVSIEASNPTGIDEDPETGATIMRGYEFDGMDVVEKGAARSNHTAAGPASNNKAIAALSAKDVSTMLDESDGEEDDEAALAASVHTPSYSGTSESSPSWADGSWDRPSKSQFDSDDLSDIGSHFVASTSGFSSPDSYSDLKLPVVEPNGNLNLNGLKAANNRVSQTDGLGDKKSAAKSKIENLASDEFDEEWGDDEEAANAEAAAEEANTESDEDNSDDNGTDVNESTVSEDAGGNEDAEESAGVLDQEDLKKAVQDGIEEAKQASLANDSTDQEASADDTDDPSDAEGEVSADATEDMANEPESSSDSESESDTEPETEPESDPEPEPESDDPADEAAPEDDDPETESTSGSEGDDESADENAAEDAETDVEGGEDDTPETDADTDADSDADPDDGDSGGDDADTQSESTMSNDNTPDEDTSTDNENAANEADQSTDLNLDGQVVIDEERHDELKTKAALAEDLEDELEETKRNLNKREEQIDTVHSVYSAALAEAGPHSEEFYGEMSLETLRNELRNTQDVEDDQAALEESVSNEQPLPQTGDQSADEGADEAALSAAEETAKAALKLDDTAALAQSEQSAREFVQNEHGVDATEFDDDIELRDAIYNGSAGAAGGDA